MTSESGAEKVAEVMDVENLQSPPAEDKVEEEAPNGGLKEKREREEEPEENASKKQKAEGGAAEDEKKADEEVVVEEKEEEVKKTGPVTVGPKTFQTSAELYDYFFKLLHCWAPNFNVNKYEALMLTDLIKQGHSEPEKKIGVGIDTFQIKYHPLYKSRCFFVVRTDGSEEDFSFRKCVDHILPLPESMKAKPEVSKSLGGHNGRRGGHGGRGRGRGGRR